MLSITDKKLSVIVISSFSYQLLLSFFGYSFIKKKLKSLIVQKIELQNQII
jgi:hypothetical protein